MLHLLTTEFDPTAVLTEPGQNLDEAVGSCDEAEIEVNLIAAMQHGRDGPTLILASDGLEVRTVAGRLN